MKQLLLFAVAIITCSAVRAQDPNPDDLLFELQWFSWRVFDDDELLIRPSPNSEWDFITMDVAFTDPFSLTAEGCGSISLNFEIVDFSDPEFFTALISDVVVDPIPCKLAVNQEYSDKYFGFFQSLEGVEAMFQIAISSPSGPERGPVSLNIMHPNGDFAEWADVPLNVSEFQVNKLELFPNPTTDLLQWKLEGAIVETAKIFSLDGRLLKTVSVQNNQLDVSFLSSGIYFLELSGADGTLVKRFIKN